MRTKKSLFIVILIAAILIGSISYFIYDKNRENLCSLGMVIPENDMFINAESSETCKDFDISFTYDDSNPPIIITGEASQEITWDLEVNPKEGVEAKDFYCTLVLNDWIVSQSSSPSLLYMGLTKSMLCDMPSDSNGLQSVMKKFVDVELTHTPEYEEQMTAPVNIMLSFNDHKEYYKVQPEFEKYSGTETTPQP